MPVEKVVNQSVDSCFINEKMFPASVLKCEDFLHFPCRFVISGFVSSFYPSQSNVLLVYVNLLTILCYSVLNQVSLRMHCKTIWESLIFLFFFKCNTRILTTFLTEWSTIVFEFAAFTAELINLVWRNLSHQSCSCRLLNWTWLWEREMRRNWRHSLEPNGSFII